MFAGAGEACNGFDDDCDGLVDEGAEPGAAASCSDGDVCTGVEICATAPAASPLVISEILFNPAAVTDAGGEWFEITNGTDAPIDLRGWTIADNKGQAHIVEPGGALFVPAHSSIVLGRSADPADNGGVPAVYAYTDFQLANTQDAIVLLDPEGSEVDFVEYGADLGFPMPVGASIALIDPSFDNADPASWDVSTAAWATGSDLGTPAGPNLDVVVPPCVLGQPLSCGDADPCHDGLLRSVRGVHQPGLRRPRGMRRGRRVVRLRVRRRLVGSDLRRGSSPVRGRPLHGRALP